MVMAVLDVGGALEGCEHSETGANWLCDTNWQNDYHMIAGNFYSLYWEG